MIKIANRYKNKGLSTVAVVLMGAAVFGLQGCSSGGDDTPSTSVTVTGGSVTEGDTGTQSITFTVTTSVAAGASTTVDYATSDGTAVAGTDYTATTGTLAIPAGATNATVTVDVIGDTAFEFDETLTLTLSNPVAVVLGATASAVGTIMDDDDADPKGYFTGVANVNSTSYSDMTGIAYNNRLMVFSPTANVLYDIVITSVSVTDFTGTVEVYVNGNVLVGNITVSGTTNESQIQGTFAGGTGFALGSFDILFDTQNNRGATLARIEGVALDQWFGDFYGFVSETGKISSSNIGHYIGQDENTPVCLHTGDFAIPDSNLNIYIMAHDVEEGITCAFVTTGYTGFASVIDDIGTDDKLIYAFANGTLSLFAIMKK